MSDTWKNSVKIDSSWTWRDGVLWHVNSENREITEGSRNSLKSKFIGLVYADQNRSAKVRNTLDRLLAGVSADGVALNIGAGSTKYQNVVNLDIGYAPGVNIVGHGVELPFQDNSVELVIMQEVLEHIADFSSMLNEIWRVLKQGGKLYCQVPFQIGFHPGPKDYWRFSRQALEYIFSKPGWELDTIDTSLGHGSGFYRIAVEFFAVTFSCVSQSTYKPTKALFALFLYPLKWFDLISDRSLEKDRIPGGYFCVARKILTSEV